MNSKDTEILRLIIKYADEVTNGIAEYRLDYERFSSNPMFKNGISMPIMQIGENCKKLSKELRQVYNKVPWVLIGDMRNKFAHGYELMNEEVIWEVALEYIPELKAYCEEILEETGNL